MPAPTEAARCGAQPERRLAGELVGQGEALARRVDEGSRHDGRERAAGVRLEEVHDVAEACGETGRRVRGDGTIDVTSR